jgi:hypothetical protein
MREAQHAEVEDRGRAPRFGESLSLGHRVGVGREKLPDHHFVPVLLKPTRNTVLERVKSPGLQMSAMNEVSTVREGQEPHPSLRTHRQPVAV